MLCAGLTLTVEAAPPGAQICREECLLLEDVADFGYLLGLLSIIKLLSLFQLSFCVLISCQISKKCFTPNKGRKLNIYPPGVHCPWHEALQTGAGCC